MGVGGCNNYYKPDPTNRWFYLFALIHFLGWTLVPTLVRYNLPLDAIEGTTWGHQLEWGYDKNPYMNAWLTALAVYLDGYTGWMVYAFSQLSVIICFWAVWRLANNILPPAYALISVMLLEGAQYYNLHAIDFNDNTLELSLWALTIYFFYKALRFSPNHLSWALVGLFAGLGMMTKYYTATLLATMFLYLIIPRDNRKHFKTGALYLSLIPFLIVTTPHFIWLFSHDFITVNYVFHRASNTPSWTNHLFFPAQFAWQQLQVFIPPLILFGLLFMGKKPRLSQPMVTTFDRSFLFYLGFGPFLLTLLLSFALGITLRAGWGMPLLSLWGILLLTFVQPHLTKTKFYNFLVGIYLLMAALLGGYAWSLIHSSTESSANFPGQKIAQTITQKWHEKYHTPLAYVAGSRWLSGNISFYSSNHPSVLIEWNQSVSPWIDTRDMQKKGALFVWVISDGENLPNAVKINYPRLTTQETLVFDYLRNNHHLAPIKIGIAYLPPH